MRVLLNGHMENSTVNSRYAGRGTLLMVEPALERRLAAILACDVAGYSRLMNNDEEGTLAALKLCRRELLDPKIAEYRGRVFKLTGDGALAEFVSTVDATRCAIQIQRSMAERRSFAPDERRIEFRIGIHVGEVIIDEGDLYGDGVNIATRIESLAPSGGLCLSENAYNQIKGKLALDVTDMGRQQLKNITQPVRVYSVRIGEVPALPPHLPKATIAVLPFENLSGEPDRKRLADGVSEDIITELSRFSSLSVIARNSSIQYKDKGQDIRLVGNELGARYLLEGSIRSGDGQLRITAQLIDAQTGTHLWADRYDRKLKHAFRVQDEIARVIAAKLAALINNLETERTNQFRTPPQ
jgi:adenylate cyclase